MTSENFQQKLHQQYLLETKDPTPVQILKTIDKNKFITNLSKETGINNLLVLENAFYPNGKPLTFKANNFKDSLASFKENDPDFLLKIPFIDEKCIRPKTGKLILRRIARKYNASKV